MAADGKTNKIFRVTCLPVMLAGLFLLAGCEKKKGEAPPPVRPVKTMLLVDEAATIGKEYPAEIRPDKWAYISFQVSGKLIELPIKRGDRVTKGQLLAKLDPRDFQNELDASRARLDQAQAYRDRIAEAVKTGAVAEQDLTDAEAQLDVAKANVRIKTKTLDDSEVRAPFAGVVAERYVENFQEVAAKQHIFNLQYIERLEVVINVPEQDVLTAERGNPGRFAATFDKIPDRKYDLEIKEFSTQADETTQTYKLRLVMLAPEDALVLPGMTATVIWHRPAAAANLFIVPASAVLSKQKDKPLVWVIDTKSMTVSAREVQIGQVVEKDKIEITGGLKAGETIAASAVHHLREGMKVRKMNGKEEVDR